MAAPANESVLGYVPGSPDRAELQAELDRQAGEILDIPLIIDGEEVRTGNTTRQVLPHDHAHVLAEVHLAGKAEIEAACASAVNAQKEWMHLSQEKRSAVFLRAAELLAGPRRAAINAATMLNQSKTCHQAEIDSACEMIDFWRFNVHYLENLETFFQPPISPPGVANSTQLRPLEGFVLAITPFNFTSIAGNLPTTPALMGGVALWKPSPSSCVSNYHLMRLLMEAGLPPGVINFLPGDPNLIVDLALQNKYFAGIHFTGSTRVFREIWAKVAAALPNLNSYPRLVGETGGKDFIVAHPDCDHRALLVALHRGAFEFQGQKCSAVSRAYLPRSVWNSIKDDLIDDVAAIPMGDPRDFTNYMGAVINQAAFDRIRGHIERARARQTCEIIAGGGADDRIGWFIEPTVIETTDPRAETMVEEIFGPVLTVYVYPDKEFAETLALCDATSPYALTGAIFANNEEDIQEALDALHFSAGNFYINDKPTGAVVGQQPFGGSRQSGTNDKAGGPLNLLRWISPRSIKRTDSPPRDWRYPFMQDS